MLSVLLITAALAVQYPPPASKPATDTSASRRPAATSRSTQAAPRDTTRSAAVSRATFHDRMRELWNDHIVYTRNFIVSAAAGTADTAEVAQRLLRNQDEIGEAIKPYYGDQAGTQLASLLRNHIQLAAKTVAAAKGNSVSMQNGMNMQDTTGGKYLSQTSRLGENRVADTVKARSGDTTQIKANAQYPTNAGRLNDTTRTRTSRTQTDTSRNRSQYPSPTARNDSSLAQNRMTQTQGQQYGQSLSSQTTVDSTSLNQAIAALKANGDSIATLLATANPRGFAQETMKGAIQQHITLLLKEATAHLKKDWSGSISAFDESEHQAMQMADMLSEGIMKQFPSRFTNKTTTVSLR